MKLKLDITKEQFDKWVAELRSGKYMQGSDYLKNRVGSDGVVCHCCLGVLCEVLEYPQINGNGSTLFQCGSEEVGTELPLFLTSAFYGYTNSCGKLPDMNTWSSEQKEKFADVVEQNFSGSFMTLTYLNDSGNFSFDRLADVIEEFLEPAR
jgi:hypothetical protein